MNSRFTNIWWILQQIVRIVLQSVADVDRWNAVDLMKLIAVIGLYNYLLPSKTFDVIVIAIVDSMWPIVGRKCSRHSQDEPLNWQSSLTFVEVELRVDKCSCKRDVVDCQEQVALYPERFLLDDIQTLHPNRSLRRCRYLSDTVPAE